MDKLTLYRDVLGRIVAEYAACLPANAAGVQNEVVHDPARDHFEVKAVGWDRGRRVHHSVLHFDIIGGKIWIQDNATDQRVEDELVAAGVPREDIVLAGLPADVRPHTGYAVG